MKTKKLVITDAGIFADTTAKTPKASKPVKTPTVTKSSTVKAPKGKPKPAPKAKTVRTPAPAGKGRTGRPVELGSWRKVTVILEERQINALDDVVYAHRQRTGVRSSYSEVLRWLVDNHIEEYGGRGDV